MSLNTITEQELSFGAGSGCSAGSIGGDSNEGVIVYQRQQRTDSPVAAPVVCDDVVIVVEEEVGSDNNIVVPDADDQCVTPSPPQTPVIVSASGDHKTVVCDECGDTYSTASPCPSSSAYSSHTSAGGAGDGYDGDCDYNDDEDVDNSTRDCAPVVAIDTNACAVHRTDDDSNETQVLSVDFEDINNNIVAQDINSCNDKCFTPKWIFIGTTVLSRWTDGLFYMGLVVQIDANGRQCLIRFEDSSLHWIRFDDLHKQLSANTVMADSDILCAICRDGRSRAPNEIVICDVCNQGYHQKCHKPCISDDILEPDIPWTCRLCVFALGTKEGGAERTGIIGRALKHMKQEFPYDLSALHWDAEHETNTEQSYCYCGGNGNYWSKMLQCWTCSQWFHEACIQALETPLLYGDHYYQFRCAVCCKGKEQLKRVVIDWSDMIAIVVNNLALQHQKRFFDLSADIVPFVQNYGNVWRMREDIQKLSERELRERIDTALTADANRFINGREVRKKHSSWALRLPFPFEKPLIFAPPSTSQSSPADTAKSAHKAVIASKQSTPKTTSAPLIYGACRKGALKHPVPNTGAQNNRTLNTSKTNANINNKPIVVHMNGRSNSCSSSTGSNSCTASTVSMSSRSSQLSLTAARAAIAKKKARMRPNPTKCKSISSPLNKRRKCLPTKRELKYTPNVSEDSCFSDTDPAAIPRVIESLDAVIPVPKNFDGHNNPFVSDVDNEIRGRLSSPLSPSPLTRISCKMEPMSPVGVCGGTDSNGAGATVPDEQTSTPKMECYLSGGSARNDQPFNILAQRVRPDGKIEYLLEWQN